MSWLSRVDRFWAEELGVEAGLLRSSGFQVRERVEASPSPAAIIVGTSAGTIVSLPRARAPAFAAAGLVLETMRHDPRGYLASFPDDAGLDVRGPAYLGYRPTPLPPRAPRRPIRELGPTDRGALAALRDRAPEEWDEAGLAPESRLFAAASGEDIVAVASYEPWSSQLAQLQVFCHPGYRRRGLAGDVLGAAVAEAITAGLLPQYRARDGNAASRALAVHLGFVEYGWMATVYLRAV
jgi:GNAT superfamily N-acetyltransferase